MKTDLILQHLQFYNLDEYLNENALRHGIKLSKQIFPKSKTNNLFQIYFTFEVSIFHVQTDTIMHNNCTSQSVFRMNRSQSSDFHLLLTHFEFIFIFQHAKFIFI